MLSSVTGDIETTQAPDVKQMDFQQSSPQLFDEGKMRNVVFALVIAVMASGCAAPRYAGSAIAPSTLSSKPEVVVVRDTDTRPGFLETIEEWLKKNDYRYVVVPDNAKHDQDKLTLEYAGIWKWDLALFLSSADIEAFHGGQRVGRVEYKAPNTLNSNKFGVGAERIKTMLDVLFGRMTAAQATEKVSGQQ